MNKQFLLNNISGLFPGKTKNISLLANIKDESFREFLSEVNGSFFFSDSLLIYSLDDSHDLSFVKMNLLLNDKYGAIVPRCNYFGCDVFGNQFGFLDRGVCFMNVEDGTLRMMSNNFDSWISRIHDDTDYFTGQSILETWKQRFGELKRDHRLLPKLPFIVGGEYSPDNLVSIGIHELIEYNSHIAVQVHSLPDGTRLGFRVDD